MKFGRTETKDAVSSETSHGVSNILTKLEQPHGNNDYYYACEIKTQKQIYFVKDYSFFKPKENEKL